MMKNGKKDYVALRKELDLQNESNEKLEKEKTSLQQEVDISSGGGRNSPEKR